MMSLAITGIIIWIILSFVSSNNRQKREEDAERQAML